MSHRVFIAPPHYIIHDMIKILHSLSFLHFLWVYKDIGYR